MTTVLETYPEIREYLDDTDDYEITASEIARGGDRLLVVTQKGVDGQQLYFKWNGREFEFSANDTVLDPDFVLHPFRVETPLTTCGSSSNEDHRKVDEHAVFQVNKFDSSSGPDGGNLACVWAVRHIVKEALGRWITRTDGTTEFAPELKACFGAPSSESEIPAGGIIISPSEAIPGSSKRNVGHVGLLGRGTGGSRPIYSNSSALARWEQNFTVASWIERYQGRKGLKVFFFPLPIRPVPLVG